MNLAGSNRVAAIRYHVEKVLPAESVRGRLARGSTWSLVANLTSRVFAMAAIIIVVRQLGKQAYGEFSIIQRTVSMFGVFGSMGLGMTATKFVSEFHRIRPEKVGRILGLSLVCAGVTSLVVCAVCWALAPWLANAVLSRPALCPLLRIGCVVLLLSAMADVLTGALVGFESFKDIARIHFGQGILNVVIAWPLVRLWGIRGALAWLALGTLSLGGIAAVQLYGRCRVQGIRCRIDMAALAELPAVWRFAVPVTLAGLMTGPVMWATSALLAGQPGGYDQLGLYNAAFQWRGVIILFPGIFGTVFFPVLSSLPADKLRRTRGMVAKSFLVCLGSAGGMATVVCLLSGSILGLYGREFIQARSILVVVMATSVLSAGNEILYRALLARGKAWWRLLSNGIWASVFVLSSLFLIPRYFGVGYAIAMLLATSAHLLVQGVVVMRNS